MDILSHIARAFDTKGYPDDKNPDNWKTMNGAKVHLDNNGNYDGGAQGKFNGKHHWGPGYKEKDKSATSIASILNGLAGKKAAEEEKKPLEAVSEAFEPEPELELELEMQPQPKEITHEDINAAWKKVVKYQVAMKQSKTEKSWNNNAEKLKQAIGEYQDSMANASSEAKSKAGKHDVSKVGQFAVTPWGGWQAKKKTGNATTPPDVLGNVASAFATPDPAPAAPPATAPSANAIGGAYTPDPSKAEYCTWNDFVVEVEDINAMMNAGNPVWEAIKDILDETVNSTNYDQYSLDDKKKIWKNFNGKGNYMDIVKKAQDIVGAHMYSDPLNNLANAFEASNVTVKEGAYKSFKNSIVTPEGKTLKAKVVTGPFDFDVQKTVAAKPIAYAMDAYNKFIDDAGDAWEKAKKAEKEAGYEYTKSYSQFNDFLRGVNHDTKQYEGIGYIPFEDADANYQGKGTVKNKIENLTSLIKKSTLKEDTCLVRYVEYKGMDKFFGVDAAELKYPNVKDLKQKLIGKECFEGAFTSCGTSEESGLGQDDPIKFKILAPAGTQAIYAEGFSHYGTEVNSSDSNSGVSWNGDPIQGYTMSEDSENETIIQRGTFYTVADIVINKKGQLEFSLQITRQQPYNLD